MELSFNKTTFVYLLTIALIAVSYVFNPTLIFIDIFAALYASIIYFVFRPDVKRYLYFVTIVFAIINSALLIKVGSHVIYNYFITLFLYLISALVFILREKGLGNFLRESFENKYPIFIIIFTVYMIFSIVIAKNKGISLVSIKNYIIMIPLLFTVYTENQGKENIKETFRVLGLLYIGILFIGMLEIFKIRLGMPNHFEASNVSPILFPNIKRMPVTFFYNPNNYALFVVLAMVVLFCLIVYSKSRRAKIFYGILYFLSQINLIMTSSRTAWITIYIFFGFVFLFYLVARNKKLFVRTVAICLATTFVFYLFQMIPVTRPYYGKFFNTPFLNKVGIVQNNIEIPEEQEETLEIGSTGSSAKRATLIYDVVRGVVFEKHYLGFGVGNTKEYIRSLNNTHGIVNVHNMWFEVLGDFGILIFIYFVFIYMNMFFNLIRVYASYAEDFKKYAAMLIFCLGSFAFLSFGPSSVMNFTTFWILMGMCAAGANLRDDYFL